MFNPFTRQSFRQRYGRKLFSLIFFSLSAFTLSAQTTLWTNPISGTNPNSNNPYTIGQTVNPFITVTGIGRGAGITGANANNRYNASGWQSGNFNISNNDYFTFSLAPLAGYRINLSSFVYTGQSDFGPLSFVFRHSSSGFATNIGTPDADGTTISLTAAAYQGLSANSEFRYYGYNSLGLNYSINDFTFNGSVLGTSVTTINGFTSCPGVAGTAQSFIVNGNGLAPANATITVAATANYEVSVTSAVAGFSGTSVSFNASGGNTAQTVWVRLKSSAALGPHNGEIVTVSGGGFAVGAGIAVTLNGNVPANDATISLATDPGTQNQVICINNPLAQVDYNMGGTATGINFSGSLPAGVTGGFSGGTYSINGTATSSGTYNYTLTTTGGTCNSSISGSVIVRDDATVNLLSGNDNQNLCQGSPISTIIYSVGGSGTGGSVSGLPAGVTYVYNAGQIMISGTPTVFGVFNYTVNTTGPCLTPSATGTITVNESSSISIQSGSLTNTICINNPLTSVELTRGGTSTGWSYTGTLPDGLTAGDVAGVFTISGTATSAGSFAITVTADGPCPVSEIVSILVNDNSSISLTSAGATTNQSVCINTPIANITYAVGAGGTGASVSGLPAGVNFNFSAGTLTISGTPTQAGSFNYLVTTTGPCINTSLGGTIDISGDATIALTSGAGSNSQTFCINNALPVNITYAVGGTGTAISVQSGTFPLGISGFFDAGVYTITGFGLGAGTFNIVLTTEGPCVTPTANVTLVVQDNSTINLTSAAGTDAQTVCVNTAISPITYAVGGGGTGATVSGLPTGVTGSFNSGVYTISGTPTQSGSFSYTITTTGPCINTQIGGTIDVTPNATIILTSAPATSNQTVCENIALADIIYTVGGSATTASISAGALPPGVAGIFSSGVFTISGSPAAAGIFNFTVKADGPCVDASLSGSITVNPAPTGLSVTPSSATICVGSSQLLTAAGATSNTATVHTTNFTALGTYTVSGSVTGARSSGWAIRANNYCAYNPFICLFGPFSSGSGNFALTQAGDEGAASSATNAALISPVINAEAYSTLTLTFRHSYKQGSISGSGQIQASADGGSNWSTVQTYTLASGQSIGSPNAFTNQSIVLPVNYANTATLRLRFLFNTSNATIANSYWGIDDVAINGQLLPLFSWSSDTGSPTDGLPVGSGTPSVTNKNVTVSPSQSTIYTLTARNSVTTCESTLAAAATVTVNQNGTIGQSSPIGTEAQTVCINTAIIDVAYNIGGAATGAQISSGTLPDGVTGTFSGGVFTISGTPAEAGTFPYTVSTTGSLCINPSLSGSITVSPDATITLSSAAGSDAQTVCINNAITPITYAIGGSGNDAGITAGTLPNGVSGSYNGGVYTISGTPTESGSFAFTITATGPCGGAMTSGTLDVTADGTIDLSSAAGTDAQTVCINTAMVDLTYIIGGTSASATISAGALPGGVSGSYNGGVYTISGTPTEAGIFSFTVSATGSSCLNPSASGTIEVLANAVVGSISGPTAVCEHVAPTGIAAVYTLSSSDPNSVFTWTLPVGALSVSGQGTNTISFIYPPGFVNGTISVDVTSTCGPLQNRTLNVGATVPQMPAAISGAKNVCPYIGTLEAITYSIDPVPGALNYNWIIPPSCSIVSGQGTTNVTFTVGANFQSLADKMVRVRVESGCGNSDYKIMHLLAQFPITPGPISGMTDICSVINTPTQVSYTINKVVAATSYVWTTPPGTTVTHPNGPGINDTVINVVFDNNFTTSLISVISVNQCTTSGSARSIMVYRKNPPTPGLISGPTNVCEYSLPSALQAYYTIKKIPVATSYTWTVPAGATVLHENASGANDTAIFVSFPNGFISGSITVKAHNGCGTSVTRSLALSSLKVGTPTPIDVATVASCPTRQFTYSLAAMPTNATSLLWSVPAGGTIDFGQGTTSILVSYAGTAIQGDVTVQAFNNCSQSQTLRFVSVKLPACPPEAKVPLVAGSKEDPEEGIFDVAVYPNPSVAHFRLLVKSSDKTVAKVRVMDMQGRVLAENRIIPGELKMIGEKLRPGNYIIEVQQGKRRKSLRAIKL